MKIMNMRLLVLCSFLIISPALPMEQNQADQKNNWPLINGSQHPNPALFAPWNRYRELKKNQPYKTDNEIKNGSVFINQELEEHIEHNNIPMVRCLLELGAHCNGDPKFSKWYGIYHRPITTAARVGNEEICALLIAAGADINAQEDEDIHAYYSYTDGKESLVERAVTHYNALWHAVYNGHIAVAQLLLRHGIENPANNIITLPLVASIELHKNYNAMKELLMSHGITVSMRSKREQYRIDTELIDHINQYLPAWAKRAITKGANVNFYDESWGNALVRACNDTRRKKFVALLLENGANPNILDSWSNTPLMFTVRTGNAKVCQMLLAYGANQLLQNSFGYTALMLSANDMPIHRAKICPILFEHQKEQEVRAVTLILCLKHHDCPSGKKLYHLSKHLLRPYLEHYTLKALLNKQDNAGGTAYDRWKIEWLKPIQTTKGKNNE